MMRFSSLASPLLSAFFVLFIAPEFLVPPLFATVIRVPLDHPTIQAGITAALPFDTVLVADGIYSGPGNRDLTFGGKDNLVVRSENGPQATVIDCGGTMAVPHRGFDFGAGVTLASVVSGFTIKGGVASGSGDDGEGGAIRCRGSGPFLENCILTENRAVNGGAVALIEGQMILADCILAGNIADAGGGLSCRQNSVGTTGRCLITGNLGSGIFADGSAMTLNFTTISGNRAQGPGGGIFSIRDVSVELNECIVWGNCNYFPDPLLNEIYAQISGNFVFTCCDVDTVQCFFDGTTTHDYGGTTIVADPIFCGPATCQWAPTAAGNYGLGSSSPCLPTSSLCAVQIGARGLSCDASGVPDPSKSNASTTLQAYPNPFRGAIHLVFNTPGPVTPELRVFDVSGRLVRAWRPEAASGSIVWDGTNGAGEPLPAGVYFAVLSALGTDTRRILLDR